MPNEPRTGFWKLLATGLAFYVACVVIGFLWWREHWQWSQGGQGQFVVPAYEFVGFLANAASAIGIGLTLGVFILQERGSKNSLETTVGRLDDTRANLNEAIESLGKKVSVLQPVTAEKALKTLKEWLERSDWKIKFWWRSGYSTIPVFWSSAPDASQELIDMCKKGKAEVSLAGPPPAEVEKLAGEAAQALVNGEFLTHAKAKRWKGNDTEVGPIQQRIYSEYLCHTIPCDVAAQTHGVPLTLHQNLKRKISVGVNWAIVEFTRDHEREFEMIVFYDKAPPGSSAVFLHEPEVLMTNNPTLAKLIIQDFHP